jgi:hypothetical protein
VSLGAPRVDGRWGGAVTKRPLPDARDELEAIPFERRRTLARIWFTQASTEARVADSFAVVHRSLVALGADAGLVAVAERAIDDEHRHAALCLDMARRYANNPDLPPVPELPFEHPQHASAHDDAERRMLWVMGQCAFNETFASAYLSLSRDVARSPLARAAISELLSDEIDHARIGWAYLETCTPAQRARLASWVHALAVANLREWRLLQLNRDVDLGPFGVPEAEAIERALVEVLAEVIVPGLERSGVMSSALAAWVKAGAPTAAAP